MLICVLAWNIFGNVLHVLCMFCLTSAGSRVEKSWIDMMVQMVYSRSFKKWNILNSESTERMKFDGSFKLLAGLILFSLGQLLQCGLLFYNQKTSQLE